jgi:ADP-ribose pyrophosphatase YjhB (NUDIX family)
MPEKGKIVKAKIKLNDVLDDILVRFVLNCPEEEGEHSAERLFFHLEEAHWFYCDEYTDRYQGILPALSFAQFARKILKKDLLEDWVKGQTSKQLIQKFNKYKYSVPTCGAILVNSHGQCLAVKGFFSKSWGFPKGKINQNEALTKCAAREVKEETGFNILPYLDSSLYVERKKSKKQKAPLRLYVVFVPDDVKFQPQTKKEISQIAWIPISMIKSLKVYKPLNFCVSQVEKMFMERYQSTDIEFHNSVKVMYKLNSKKNKEQQIEARKQSNRNSANVTTLQELESQLFIPLEPGTPKFNIKRNKSNHQRTQSKHDRRNQSKRFNPRPRNMPQRQNSFGKGNPSFKQFSFDRMKIDLLS